MLKRMANAILLRVKRMPLCICKIGCKGADCLCPLHFSTVREWRQVKRLTAQDRAAVVRFRAFLRQVGKAPNG